MIDTHCHLTFADFQDPRYPGGVAAVLEKAAAEGVTGAITISTTTRDCLKALAIAEAFPNVWCSSGVHPLYSHEGPHEWANLARVAASPRCVAWGELGLDHHYEGPHRAVQFQVLEEQLAFIKQVREQGIDRPIVLHCREAFADLIPILKGSGLDTTRMVFHCFTGTVEEARAVLDIGAWISFTGVVTYKNAPDVREAAGLMPADRIMIETDAPFLSPEPHRGQRPCQPWMSAVTARFIASLRREPWDAFHAQINANVQRFFGV
ncbi:MAG TPA: TatD family hydrolase [Phycisphaerales bacterium]|nr:TatD family hydrolase [Phycisphaerales bacterium]